MAGVIGQVSDHMSDMIPDVPDKEGLDTEEVSTEESAQTADSSQEEELVSDGSVEVADDAPLQRTQSQVVKRIKVDEVTAALAEHREPVEQLRRALSQLSKTAGTPDGEDEDLASRRELAAEKLRQADRLQQGLRNYGEDLMEGMLALDRLDRLAKEDRLARKEAIGQIQGLLDDIDSAKPRVAQLRKRLAAELEQLQPERASHDPEILEAASPTAEPAPPAEATGCQEVTRVARPRKRLPRQTNGQLVMPRVDWSKVELPAKFSVAERPKAYVLSASLSGLMPESIRLIRKDGGVLSIQGLRLPTAAEQKDLDQALDAHLDGLPFQHRQRLQQESVEEMATQLGRGSFGLARREFELPRDVDWAGIEAFYEEGVLRVVLPRVALTARDFGGNGLGFPWQGRSLRSAGYPRRPGGSLPDFMW